jgi:glycosyltransferase involved in cell wall biosynthesis
MHLHTYEFIFFDGFSTIQYAKHLDSKHIYIDDEDITDLLWKRVNTKGNIFLQVFYIVEWVKCMVYERIYFLRMARIWAISPNTRHRLRQLTKARTVCMPTIIPLQRSAFRATSRHLVFSGLLSWQENVVGLRWFLKECWPSIHADFPNTKLYITGQMADPMIVQDAHTIPGVELVGFVTSLKDVYTRCAIAIAPIFINSGIKVKVLTYLSFGLPTVSSKEAWLGMSSTAGLIITDKRTFTDAVKKLLLDTDMRINLSKQGTNNIRTNHSKDALLAFFRSEKII